MTAPTITQASGRSAPTTHLFSMGQPVRLRGSLYNNAYRVTRLLPPLGKSPQYRIRSEDEHHERVTTEDKLSPAGTFSASASLIERTFGNGKRPEAQQSGNKEAEAGEGTS